MPDTTTSSRTSGPAVHHPPAAALVRRIVVGYDGSEASVAALKLAGRLAARFDSDLRIVNVYERPYAEIAPDDEEGLLEAERLRVASEVAATVATRGDRTSVDVADGGIEECLLEAARAADLLVAGSRVTAGVTPFGFGSLTHHLAHRISCPLLVVPAGEWSIASDQPVVAGIDSSTAGPVVLGWARRFAAGLGSHTVAAQLHPGLAGPWQAAGTGPDVTFSELDGSDPTQVLADVADAECASFVIVGAKVDRSLGGVLLGEVGDEVLHVPTRPTVLVPHDLEVEIVQNES